MCCQEMGEKEATVALFCPKAAYDEPKVRKVEMNTSSLSLIIHCFSWSPELQLAACVDPALLSR